MGENVVTNIEPKLCWYRRGGESKTNNSLLTFETIERYIKMII